MLSVLGLVMSHIEGVPLGTRLDGIRSANPNEHCIGIGGEIVLWNQPYKSNCVWPVIKPDNVYNVLDLSTVAIPDGYKRVSENWFREPKLGELFKSGISGDVAERIREIVGPDLRRIILEPIKPRTRQFMVLEYEVIEGQGWGDSWVNNTVGSGTASDWVRTKRGNARIEERPV